jgi:hypothetical protein
MKETAIPQRPIGKVPEEMRARDEMTQRSVSLCAYDVERQDKTDNPKGLTAL